MSDVIKQLANELSSTLLQLEQVKRERDAYLQLHVETTQLLADARAKLVQHQRESVDKLKRAIERVDRLQAESAKRDEAYRQLEGWIAELKAKATRREEQSAKQDNYVADHIWNMMEKSPYGRN